MPSATALHDDVPTSGRLESTSRLTSPLKYSGLLDSYKFFDSTPVIGREFQDLQVTDLLGSPNSDSIIKDLAVTISQRGVVFLKNQDVTTTQMKELASKLSEQSGCPQTSTLHIHPITEEGSELGDEISVINSEKSKGLSITRQDVSLFASRGWHSDITWEPAPSDYTMLRIHTLPPTGGDTIWSSGCEIYDRLSPAVATMLEGLTATHSGSVFAREAERRGQAIRTIFRGSPLNKGSDLEAVHPVIRTNPVTGWKSVFVNRVFTKRINGVTKDESDLLLNYLFGLLVNSHDTQVRFKWSKNDLAIWDNRSNWHIATFDVEGVRIGDRVVSIGEAPYYDAASKSRKAALAEDKVGN